MKNNQIQMFEHEDLGKIRIINIGGEPWFVGKDVSDILGYSNSRKALLDHVDAQDKLASRFVTSGQNRSMTAINESGLYSLILSSKLPQAKAFKRWVTSEILPSIRKHGAYVTESTLSKMTNTPGFTETLLDALAEEHSKNVVLEGHVKALAGEVKTLNNEVDVLEGELKTLEDEVDVLEVSVEILEASVEALDDKVETLTPKARYYDRVIHSGDAIPVSIIAKDYGMTAMAFNRLLRDFRIQYKVDGTWLLYKKYANKGYVKTKTFYKSCGGSVVHTYWLQKGRRFLYEVLALSGIYPIAGGRAF